MYEEEFHFGKLLLKQSYMVLTNLTPSDVILWPSDPKINRIPMLLRIDVWTRYEKGWSRHSRVINLKRFWHIWLWWPWPLTQCGSIGLFCYPGWMCGPSLRKVGQGILELLMGNEKVTDGRTDRQTYQQTCTKQYALSSSKGGIKTTVKFSFSLDFISDKVCNSTTSLVIPIKQKVICRYLNKQVNQTNK